VTFTISGSVAVSAALTFALLAAGCGSGSDDRLQPATGQAPATIAPAVEPDETTPQGAAMADDEQMADEEEHEATQKETVAADKDGAQQAGALDGMMVYRETGCGSCHGALAGGTKIAPALPGHAPKVIRRQVRAATGSMPSYPREQLSQAELTAIVEWIATLPVPKQHVEPISVPQLVASHYRMAFVALKFEERKDALHHLGHIAASVKGKQLAGAKEIRALVRAGSLHDAEHAIQKILGAEHGVKLGSVEKLHLQVALGAAQARDFAQVRHHMTHFLQTAKGKRAAAGEAILAATARRDEHDVVDGIRDLIGLAHR